MLIIFQLFISIIVVDLKSQSDCESDCLTTNHEYFNDSCADNQAKTHLFIGRPCPSPFVPASPSVPGRPSLSISVRLCDFVRPCPSLSVPVRPCVSVRPRPSLSISIRPRPSLSISVRLCNFVRPCPSLSIPVRPCVSVRPRPSESISVRLCDFVRPGPSLSVSIRFRCLRLSLSVLVCLHPSSSVFIRLLSFTYIFVHLDRPSPWRLHSFPLPLPSVSIRLRVRLRSGMFFRLSYLFLNYSKVITPSNPPLIPDLNRPSENITYHFYSVLRLTDPLLWSFSSCYWCSELLEISVLDGCFVDVPHLSII